MSSSVVSQSAKTVTVFLAVFAAAGALWGLWRPAVTAVVSDSDGVAVDPSTNGAPFQAFAVYAVATGLLGGLLGAWAFWRTPALRGPVSMLAVVVLAFVGSVVFLVFGNYIADAMTGEGLEGDVAPGDSLEIMTQISGAVGYLAAPAVAAITYWACALFSPDEAFSRQ
ncbi:MAG TPA: hypothetical protein H9870_11600 [Candidatus Corynebacterium avicola]|uniref:DUF2567 domain-containing protein n=1 Tax=Candidatus Corynebacterium avicola TaxID=2838527 RepID=A0A9D1RT75_9CORY|nr:hypothetical protein [Candidatus Corynebacterium avicola]